MYFYEKLIVLDHTMKKKKISSQERNQDSANELNREARVQSIKEAIEAGTYRIDNLSLANSLLSDLLQEQWERIRIKKQ